MKIDRNHIVFKAAPEIANICEPLKKHFGITSVVYHKLFNDGSAIRLGTNPEWIKHFLENEFYSVSTFEHHPDTYKSGFVLWSQLTTHSAILKDAREKFNIDHIVTLIDKVEDGVEYMSLGTLRENPGIVQIYLNNMDLLKQFMLYFKHKAAKFIQSAEKNKLSNPGYFSIKKPLDPIVVNLENELTRSRFMNEIQVWSSSHEMMDKISKREKDCANYLMQGMTSREIGEKLFISSRTVEAHLEHLKRKLGCRTKSTLISKLIQAGFSTH